MRGALVGALLGGAAASEITGGVIKLAFSDCGDSSTHGHITSLSPSSLTLGAKTSLSGKGSMDEAIQGLTYKVDSKAAGITIFSHSGDACKPETITLPAGAGELDMKGFKCPIAAGNVELDLDLTLSANIPASLARVTIDLTATASSGDKALCVKITTAPGFSKGYKRSQYGANMPVAEITDEEIASAPNAVDWSAKGATTSINDQGSCGSCWAFSTTEGVESAVFMSSGKLPGHLSVQELVACEKQDDGCDGGDIPEAVTYLKKNGMASNSDYPDSSSKSGRTGRCTWNKESVVTVTGMKYAIPPCTSGNCANQNEEALAAALAKYGPLSICINSGDGQSGDWMPYKSGILKGSCKAKANLIDHCVQLVGYDKSGGYWKIRNSWGKSWGENGFIRIPYGNQNECCVGCEAVIVSATQSSGNEVVV
jgi:hypothetical protein